MFTIWFENWNQDKEQGVLDCTQWIFKYMAFFSVKFERGSMLWSFAVLPGAARCSQFLCGMMVHILVVTRSIFLSHAFACKKSCSTKRMVENSKINFKKLENSLSFSITSIFINIQNSPVLFVLCKFTWIYVSTQEILWGYDKISIVE